MALIDDALDVAEFAVFDVAVIQRSPFGYPAMLRAEIVQGDWLARK